MYRDNAVPATPDIAPKIKYKVPISLWFVEKKSTSYKFVKRI